MANEIKIVDGTARRTVDEPHPSLEEDINELELDDIPADEDQDTDHKDDKKPKKEDLAEDVDELEDTDEEEAPEEDADEDQDQDEEDTSDDETPDEEDPPPAKVQKEQVDVGFDSALANVVSEIKASHLQLEMLAESMIEMPERPKDDDDEEAMIQYRHDLAAWKTESKKIEKQQKLIQGRVKQACAQQEGMFRDKHSEEDLSGFEQWMLEAKEFQVAFATGRRTLESLYRMYKADVGIVEDSVKTVKAAKKNGSNIKPVKLKSSATPNKGTHVKPFPKQFKYANMKENKEEVRYLLKNGNPLTGQKMSLKEIDSMLKSDYAYKKGKII